MTSSYDSHHVASSCSPSSDTVLPVHGHEIRTLLPDESIPSFARPGAPEFDNMDITAMLKFITGILMEEEGLEGKSGIVQDCEALQAAEKPFYDVIGQKYPYKTEGMLDCKIDGSSDSLSNVPITDKTSCLLSDDCLTKSCHYQIDSPESILSGPEFCSVSCSCETLEHNANSSAASSYPPLLLFKTVNSSYEEDKDQLPRSSSGMTKTHLRDEDHLVEERSRKQSASSLNDPDGLSELFETFLFCPFDKRGSISCIPDDSENTETGSSGQRKRLSGKSSRGKKQGKEKELVDIWTLLTQCAQAVASSDPRTASELLTQLKLHSLVNGDVNQRLAYYFSMALQYRLVGKEVPSYEFHLNSQTNVLDVLRGYQMYVEVCPFHIMSYFFANRIMENLVESSSKLHIIDFGIDYAFQWPCIIKKLSERPGGPPKLRITGIELPQPGLKPAQRVEETMERLKRYSKKFKVEFECSIIVKKWETIRLEEIRLESDEVTVVNCMFRMKNIADDTIAANSPRNTVLNLIHRIKPVLFIHGIVNGSHNAPFFLTRFREALFYFSTMFDLLEATVPRTDDRRLIFERLVYGRDIMNIIAGEGVARVERPETYKQWQSRIQRAGFRQVPLDREVLNKMKWKTRLEFNKDYVVDEDGHWVLQGWKGKITRAIAVWKPV